MAFQAVRDRVQDQSGKPETAARCTTGGTCPKKAAPYYSVGFYNGLDPNDFFVEPGSYAKLKELSVNYTFVGDQLRSIGLGGLQELRLRLVAREPFPLTDYSGVDSGGAGPVGGP